MRPTARRPLLCISPDGLLGAGPVVVVISDSPSLVAAHLRKAVAKAHGGQAHGDDEAGSVSTDGAAGPETEAGSYTARPPPWSWPCLTLPACCGDPCPEFGSQMAPETAPTTTQGPDPLPRIRPLNWCFLCRGGGI